MDWCLLPSLAFAWGRAMGNDRKLADTFLESPAMGNVWLIVN